MKLGGWCQTVSGDKIACIVMHEDSVCPSGVVVVLRQDKSSHNFDIEKRFRIIYSFIDNTHITNKILKQRTFGFSQFYRGIFDSSTNRKFL